MPIRYPELMIQSPMKHSTADEESGVWCPPGLEPDETRVNILEEGPAVQYFGQIRPCYTTLHGPEQEIVAVSSPHIANPDHHFYQILPELFDSFAHGTALWPRITLHEANQRPVYLLAGPAPSIIAANGDMVYLQALSYHAHIPAQSTEPPRDADMRSIQQNYPELATTVREYAIARLLPQIYRRRSLHYTDAEINELRQQILESEVSDPERMLTHWLSYEPISSPTKYLLEYSATRRKTMQRKDYDALYSPDPIYGHGSVRRVARHLANEHDCQVSVEELCTQPRIEVIDQIFRCTNSPVYMPRPLHTHELCTMQKVAALANRLRDRHTITLLAQHALRGTSIFWMSGPLHYEVAQRALDQIAILQNLTTQHHDIDVVADCER
jgi:hypothetical protein